jgi:hypothetical protein
VKRKFAVLYIVAALAALAIPASSMAAMYPAGHKFEIGGPGRLETSLGECKIAKIAGTIPASPSNAGLFQIPAPTVGSCSSGTTLSLSGEWKFGNPTGTFFGTANTYGSGNVTMRFASLPGCKLTNTGALALMGVWSNGTTTPNFVNSGYHADSGWRLTWANDGGTCALAGTEEFLEYVNRNLPGSPAIAPMEASVINLTNPSTVITVGP